MCASTTHNTAHTSIVINTIMIVITITIQLERVDWIRRNWLLTFVCTTKLQLCERDCVFHFSALRTNIYILSSYAQCLYVFNTLLYIPDMLRNVETVQIFN